MSKILILDDSIDLLETLQFILEKRKYLVKTLNIADHICEEIYSFDPDLLIMSVLLTDADGRNICKELKNNVETKHLFILLFSASHQLLVNYKNDGADDYLEKPFDLDIFETKVKSLLELALIRTRHTRISSMPLHVQ